MAKSEPSLVPQWLKSSGGGGHLLSHNQHQEDIGPLSVRSGGSSGRGLSGDSSPYSSQYSFGRHGGGAGPPSGGSHSRAGDWHDRAPLPYSSHSSHMYPRYGSNNSYRGYDVPDYRGGWDRESGSGERNQEHWDSREREREFSRSMGFTGDERDGIDAVINSGSGIRPYQPPGRRYEESSQRMMGGGRASGDTRDRALVDVTPVGATSAFSSRLSDKVAFERNFPSLGGSQDRQVIHSPKGVVTAMSPRYLRQPVVHSPRSGLGGTPSPPPPLSMPPGVSALLNPSTMNTSLAATSALVSPGGDGRSVTSVLADSLATPTGTLASSGLSGGGAFPGSPVSKKPLDAATPGLHVRVGNQAAVDRQRSEEVTMKPLQLVQMKPSLVKNPGVSPRDGKTKTKPSRLVEAPSVLGRSGLNGQLVGIDRHRPSELRLPESGRSSPVGPGPLGSASGGGLGTQSPAGSGILSGAHPSVGPGVRQKTPTLMDRHALPIAPTASLVGGVNGTAATNGRPKDGIGTADEKRVGMQSQNRSDFFNALRKKSAAGNGSPQSRGEKAEMDMAINGKMNGDKMEGSQVSVSLGGPKDRKVEVQHVKNDSDELGGVEGGGKLGDKEGELGKMVLVVAGAKESVTGKEIKAESGSQNGAVNGDSSIQSSREKTPGTLGAGVGESGVGIGANGFHPVNNGEKLESPELLEEFSFLRSLGWNEEDCGEGALTEEEINGFLKKLPCQGKKTKLPMPTRTFSRPPVRNRVPQLLYKDSSQKTHMCPSRSVVAGSVGSVSSGCSSSDSEDDAQK
eukprot:TRINITY_DN7388_c0_g1_i1.p1 TRINITY_DN7388_c0_g1~~TRINITY_DN7388_c0_g1_i1.p1  ORF type:complete len:794 (+),score=172.62 TRINITY_DN7388_c0_g1_i1:378-2759(+)